MNQIIEQSGINVLQFHGDENPEFCGKFRLPVVKAFRVKDQSSLEPMTSFRASAFLLDSHVPGQLGGTGERFNWDIAVQAKRFNRPVILAGGLTSENVRDAVAKVLPYGVDVSSGVETAPGKKDPAKVRSFISNAKAAFEG